MAEGKRTIDQILGVLNAFPLDTPGNVTCLLHLFASFDLLGDEIAAFERLSHWLDGSFIDDYQSNKIECAYSRPCLDSCVVEMVRL